MFVSLAGYAVDIRPLRVQVPVREMVRSLAQIGGFLARKGDGEPGLKTIWQGYQRLHDFIYAVDTYRTVQALERNV